MPKKSPKKPVQQPIREDSPVRILYLENDPMDFEMVQRHFETKQFDAILRRAETREQFLEGLAGFNPDLILLDVHLPLFNVKDALYVLNEQKIGLPVVLYTGSVGEEQAVEYLKLGADDYVTKQNPVRLISAVKAAIEKKKKAIEYQKNTNELDHYFEHSLDLLCIADTDGYFRKLNPEWERTLGYPVSELIGKRFLDFVHPDDIPSTLDAMTRLSSQKEVLNFENRYRCKDGSYRWIEWRSYPEKNAIFAVARDITDRKTMEENLQKKTQDLASLLEISKILASTLDWDQILQSIIEQAIILTKLDSGAIYLLQAEELYLSATTPPLPADFPEIFRRSPLTDHPHIQTTISSKMPHFLTDPTMADLSRAEKMIVEMRGLTSVLYLPLLVKKQALGVMIVGTIGKTTSFSEEEIDLYLTMANQAALTIVNADLAKETKEYAVKLELEIEERKRSEETLSSIYRTVGDVIFQLAVEPGNSFRFISVNPVFTKVTGLNQDQIVGKMVNEIIPEPSLTMVLKKYREAIQKEKIVKWEETSDYPTGRLTGEVIIAPLFDEYGKCTHLVGSVHDITDRVKTENSLRTLSFRQEAILAAVPDIIMEVDNNKVYTWANKAGSDFFGEDVIGKEAAFYFEGEQDTYGVVQPIFDGAEGLFYVESWQRRKDGQKRLLSWWCRVLKDARGNVTGALSSAQDITERKQADEKIRKANRIYAVISQINQAIVRTREKDKLLAEVCRIAIEYGKFRLAWIGLVEEGEKVVKPSVFEGVEDGYLSMIKKISISDVPEGRGPTGTAIREGRHFICNDIENDQRMTPWKDEAIKRCYRSSIALPLKMFGKVIGAFSLYSEIPHFFDQQEIDLLVEVTNDISFALETIETEKKRQEAEEKILDQLHELQRWQKVTIGREDRNIELKHEVNDLLKQLGRQDKYQ